MSLYAHTPPEFICVGGPMDGKWKAWDAPRFYVQELQEPIGLLSQAAEPLRTIQHCYALSEHEVYGTAWVYQP